MHSRERRDHSLTIERDRGGARPERVGCYKRDIQRAFHQGSKNLIVIQFVKCEDDTRMASAPAGQQRLQRLPNRRHPDTQPKAPALCCASSLSGTNHVIDCVETSPDLDHDVTAGWSEAHSEGSSFEDRDAELILEPGDAAADRRRL